MPGLLFIEWVVTAADVEASLWSLPSCGLDSRTFFCKSSLISWLPLGTTSVNLGMEWIKDPEFFLPPRPHSLLVKSLDVWSSSVTSVGWLSGLIFLFLGGGMISLLLSRTIPGLLLSFGKGGNILSLFIFFFSIHCCFLLVGQFKTLLLAFTFSICVLSLLKASASLEYSSYDSLLRKKGRPATKISPLHKSILGTCVLTTVSALSYENEVIAAARRFYLLWIRSFIEKENFFVSVSVFSLTGWSFQSFFKALNDDDMDTYNTVVNGVMGMIWVIVMG